MGGGAWPAAGEAVTVSAQETLVIRACVPADLERIALIERVSFSDPWTFEAFSAALALPHLRFFVAEDTPTGGRGGGGSERSLVGYVVALVMADEGEIADVAVAPAARRRGIARHLLVRVMVELVQAGVRTLYLEVRESNVPAKALYASLGFEQVGRRRGYYQHPSEDALLLKRDLASK
jgi:[ribosomal protein S18]-alanine N-acetyltransferase